MRLLGLSILAWIGLMCLGAAHADPLCPTFSSALYGYSYGTYPAGTTYASCPNAAKYKTLEELETVLHAQNAANEIAFPIPRDFDSPGRTPAGLDYRPRSAVGTGSASIGSGSPQASTDSFKAYLKSWPSSNAQGSGTCAQPTACTGVGNACLNPTAEIARLTCELNRTWTKPGYCWRVNGTPASQTAYAGNPSSVTTNSGGSSGALNYNPASSTDTGFSNYVDMALTACNNTPMNADQTSQVRQPDDAVPSQGATTQTLHILLSKLSAFICPTGATVNGSATSLANACTIAFNKLVVDVPAIQQFTPQAGDCYGNPCVPGTGNKLVHENGFRYGEIAFDLTYNSLRQTRSFGYIDRNWSHSFAKRLLTNWIATGGEITVNSGAMFVQDEQAHLEVYRPDPLQPTVYRSTNTVGNVMRHYPAVGGATPTPEFWELYHANGAIDLFDAAGRLQQMIDPDDPRKTLTLTYVLQAINGTAPTGAQAPGEDTNHFQEGFWRIGRVTDGNGRFITFNYDTTIQMWLAKIVADDGVTELMKFSFDSAHRLTSTTQFGMTRQYLYNEVGNVQAATSVEGYSGPVVGYWLTGILDEETRRFATFKYDDWGRVTDSWHGPAAAPAGKFSVTYTDDTSAVVTMPLGDTKTITYQTGTSVAEPYRHPQSTTNGSGTEGFVYDQTTHRKKTQTDPNGTTTTFEYDSTAQHETARTEALGKPEQRRIETDWDAGTNRISEQRIYADPSGGTRTLETKTSYTYDVTTGHLNTVTQTDPVTNNTRIWKYNYCVADNSTSGCLAGYLQTIDGPRLAADVIDVTTYSYYTTSSTVAGNTYHRGDLKSVKNAAGHIVTFAQYNARGQVLRRIDANGVPTDFAYTSRGWLQSRTVRANATGASAGDAATSFAYDNVGNVKKITLPDGSYQYFGYDDAERLTDVWDSVSTLPPPSGNHIHYNLDADGHRTNESTTTASGMGTRYLFRTYDLLGHLQKTLDANYAFTTNFTANNDPTPGAVRGYDPNGNPTHFQDGLGVQTEQKYDALNRLKNTLQDYQGTAATANTSTQYAYDARNNVRSVTDPSMLTTTYTYDGLSNLTNLNSPDTEGTSYLYDSAGNRIQKIDARNKVSTYAYDALNRMTAVAYPAASSLNIGYAYDQSNSATGCTTSYPLGRLTKMTDSSGSTIYCYDHRGNVLRKVQVTNGFTYTTGYTYTLANRLSTITYPSGAIVTYGRDNVGRVNAVSYQTNATAAAVSLVAANGVTYYPFGPLNTMTFGNGRTVTKTYDGNYGIATTLSSARSGLDLKFNLDVMSNIIGALAPVPNYNAEQFLYDPLYRLTGTSTFTTQAAYTYNQTGDRLSNVQSGITQPYAYLPATHLLASVGGTARSYDNNGNTTAQQTGQYPTLAYDDRGRLTSAAITNSAGGSVCDPDTDICQNYPPSSQTVYYTLNGLGERVGKVTINVTGGPILKTGIGYDYDQSGRLLGEYAAAGHGGPTNEYIYLDNTPIGYVSNGTLYYIETDHLGTPRQVIQPGATTASDTLVWTWDYFGNAFGSDVPSLQTITFNLRYPGQYFDAETGLHYNRFRDYEPGTGRYVESDPIGLRGGLNTFGYAFENPLSFMDIFGLCADEKKCRPGIPGHMSIIKSYEDNISEQSYQGTMVVLLQLLDECFTPIRRPGYQIQEHVVPPVRWESTTDWHNMSEFGTQWDTHAPSPDKSRNGYTGGSTPRDQTFSIIDPTGVRYELATMMRTFADYVNGQATVHTETITP